MIDTEDGGDSGDYATTSYDAGDTVGLGGSMGDDAVHEDNWADYEYTDDVDASETTGLTNDGTVVVENNDPADVEDEYGDDYLPGSNLDREAWLDSATTEDGNSPGGTGAGAQNPNTQGDITNWVADVSLDTYDAAAGAAEDAAPDPEDFTPDWLDWVLDNAGLVLAGIAVLAAMFVARPYAGLANSAT